MNLLTLTSDEVAGALADNPGVIIPIGSVEQHGPIGLIGCDTLCAESVAQEAGRLGSILIAPVLAYTSNSAGSWLLSGSDQSPTGMRV